MLLYITLRLGVCPRSIGSYQWGGQTKLSLADDPTYDTTIIPGIPMCGGSWSVSDSEIFDESSPDGFKQHNATSPYRAGFTSALADIGDVNKGDVVPLGMIETLRLIAHRNKILRDSGINLPVPVKSSTESEREALTRMMKAAQSDIGSAYTYYYPAASYAYSYCPFIKETESLSEKFASHKWFLPSPGDMMRIGKMVSRGDFTAAVARGYLNSTWVQTSGFFAVDKSVTIDMSSGAPTGDPSTSFKYTAHPTYPMVVF